ncbi:MAG TPA: hypothetical protein VGO11_01020 [Chthoniobacteraceae bacterium]|jgi:hypothetical protein|nr:hypothetical protein [Chthoniobacteraceae bacterium]
MNLNTSIDFLKDRLDKTRAVQTQIAATWLWPLKTAAQWAADSDALDKSVDGSLANVAIEAHTTAEAARGVLDTRLHAIHAQTVAVAGVMRARAARQPESKHVVDELSARADSRDGIEKEGTAVLSAWKLEFDGAAFEPAPGVTYDAFRDLFHGHAADPSATPPVAAMPSLRELKEAYSDKATLDRRETGRLNARLGLVERDCQDWYAEATKVFVAGTEIGDLIRSEVPTSDDYSPSAPPIPPPVPPAPPVP